MKKIERHFIDYLARLGPPFYISTDLLERVFGFHAFENGLWLPDVVDIIGEIDAETRDFLDREMRPFGVLYRYWPDMSARSADLKRRIEAARRRAATVFIAPSSGPKK